MTIKIFFISKLSRNKYKIRIKKMNSSPVNIDKMRYTWSSDAFIRIVFIIKDVELYKKITHNCFSFCLRIKKRKTIMGNKSE